MESTRATTNESINIGMTVHPTHQSKHAKKKNYLPRTKPKPLWRSESLLAARSSNSDNFLLHKAKSSELLAGYQSGWKISQDCRRLRFTCMPIMPICVWHAHWHSEWERMSFWPTFFGIVTWGKLNMVCKYINKTPSWRDLPRLPTLISPCWLWSSCNFMLLGDHKSKIREFPLKPTPNASPHAQHVSGP